MLDHWPYRASQTDLTGFGKQTCLLLCYCNLILPAVPGCYGGGAAGRQRLHDFVGLVVGARWEPPVSPTEGGRQWGVMVGRWKSWNAWCNHDVGLKQGKFMREDSIKLLLPPFRRFCPTEKKTERLGPIYVYTEHWTSGVWDEIGADRRDLTYFWWDPFDSPVLEFCHYQGVCGMRLHV